MTSPLHQQQQQSSSSSTSSSVGVSSATLSILIDQSVAAAAAAAGLSLPFCRPASHLARPSAAHLQHTGSSTGGACPGSVEATAAAVLASGFGGGAFIGGFVGGAAGPTTGDGSAFYSPPHIDNAIDGWHHPAAAAAAAAAAAVGLGGGGAGGVMGGGSGWAFDPCRPIGGGYTTYGSVSYGLDVRRKNATRESTSTLKAWLFDHIKNPYPTKGEKIMLAIITKMTLTQVSTWFANARRRLKKENKMQWSPRNRTGDDDDDDDDKNSDNDDVIIGDRTSEEREESSGMMMMNDDDEDIVVDAGNEDSHPGSSDRGIDVAPHRCYTATADDPATRASSNGAQRPECIASRPEQHGAAAHRGFNIRTFAVGASGGNDLTSGGGFKDGGVGRDLTSTGSAVVEKPRIWSLADVATSSVTPSSVYHRQRTSPSVSEHQLPVRTNDLLSHHHHHRYDVIPQSPAATSAVVHHSFQPWTKRFLSAGPSIVAAPSSVHPFAHKLIPGYVPYLGLGGAQGFRQDPCAAVACNGVDVVARSHAPPTTAAYVAGGGGGGVVVGALSSPTPHRLEFAKVLTNGLVPDERTVNPGGKYSSLTIGYISHPPSSSPPSSSSSSAPILSNSSSSSSTSSPKSSPICSSASTTPSSPSSCHPLVPPMMLPSTSSQPSDKRS